MLNTSLHDFPVSPVLLEEVNIVLINFSSAFHLIIENNGLLNMPLFFPATLLITLVFASYTILYFNYYLTKRTGVVDFHTGIMTEY